MPCGHGSFSFLLFGPPARRELYEHRNPACPLRVGICALRARRLFLFCCLGRLRGARQMGFRSRHFSKNKAGLSFERRLVCPAGTELLIYLVWAACAAGGRWGPVRGCRPSEAPSALPPDDPAGLVASLHSHEIAFKGLPYPTITRGLRGLCSGSFLASLGDLPPRRAKPAYGSALNERTGGVWLAEELPNDSGLGMIFFLR